MKKRILSMLLAMIMVVGMLPTVALAAEDGTTWDGTTVATAYAGGTGTEADPYIIATAGQLIYLRNEVNGGTEYNGMYFRLDADLDMNSKTFGDAIGSGTSNKFNGHFDGNGYKISNLTIGNSNGYSALFGNVGFNNQEVVIKNLTLVNVNVTRTATNYGAAALVGRPKYVRIENCTVESGTVKNAAYYTGGLVATLYTSNGTYGLTIINCVNKANVTNNSTSSNPYTGGILGSGKGAKITGCTNYGTITTNKYYAGGIAGSSHASTIEKCANYGSVSSTQGSASGILADGSNEVVKNCYNQGNITAGKYATGITGLFGSTSGHTDTDTIENCYSVGTINGTQYSHAISKKGSYPNSCTLKNNYSLSAGDAYVTQKTAEEFADGTVAKLLQEPNDELVWGQTIGTDNYPVFYNGNNSVMPKTYTVMWMVDETEYYSEDLEEGDAIIAPENPTKAAVGCTTYTFANWDAEIPETMPAENLTFNAVFTEETKHTLDYTNNDDGTHSATCACGAEVIEKETHTYDEDGLCDCGEQKPEKFAITLVQAELGNDLHLYFLFPADAYEDWTGCYAVVTKTYADGRDDVTVTVPASEWTEKINGTTLKRVGFHNISAKEMADTIRIVVYNAEDEAISEEGSDSLAGYLMRMLDTNTDSEFRTLAVDMLNYGAAAQTQFGYNTGNLANASLTEEQKAYGTAADADCVNNQVKGDNVRGVSVELNNNIIMNVYFTNQTADMTATVTFTNHNGNEITADLTSTESANGYCFEVDQLAVADMRALVTVTCYNADGSVYGTVTDSVESYVARTGLTKAINQAIMKFSDSAKAYLH